MPYHILYYPFLSVEVQKQGVVPVIARRIHIVDVCLSLVARQNSHSLQRSLADVRVFAAGVQHLACPLEIQIKISVSLLAERLYLVIQFAKLLSKILSPVLLGENLHLHHLLNPLAESIFGCLVISAAGLAAILAGCCGKEKSRTGNK